MKIAKYLFGDIVVVDNDQIGVIVKTWQTELKGRESEREDVNYEVYVRSENGIREFGESKVERYRVRHKYLDEQELEYQSN